MKYILKRKTRAFTLLEVLLSMVISSLIILSALNIFYNSYFDNLNQRKYFVKFNEIDYTLNYIERELLSAVEVSVVDGNLKIINYSYNDFSKDTQAQKIKNIKEVIFERKIVNKKISVDRIVWDMLNKNDEGKNLILSNVDSFDVVVDGDVVAIKISYKSKIFERIIKVDNLKRFEYE